LFSCDNVVNLFFSTGCLLKKEMKFTIKNDNGFFSSSLEVIYDFVYNKCTVTLLSFGNENLFELLFKFQREKN